ncbi:MAG: hypothetical protein U5R49_25600 [Deltaproteobacteria bacterium]|nr:hypothetical protein [Deltaproteobacteria bacterium]
MKPLLKIPMAKHLMYEFAMWTGLDPAQEVPRRYLWTDAFAVCNFLGLHKATGDECYQSLALRLIDQVHHVLGRHRTDDERKGWISGLAESEGEHHPTQGGLRIGKKLNERKPSEPYDTTLEWDQDGQYFHYLTRWMHALHCAHRATGERRFSDWALELGKTAHARFIYGPDSKGKKSMYWKMSIDLSYPLVPSMGRHDPLDGFITLQTLRSGRIHPFDPPDELSLEDDIADMAKMCEGRKWMTEDPLGLGGLLCDAFRVAQLIVHGCFDGEDLLEAILRDARFGLGHYARKNHLDAPAVYRLAFRELGLSIGFHAFERLEDMIDHNLDRFQKRHELQSGVQQLAHYRPLGRVIESFWLDPRSREADTWKGPQGYQHSDAGHQPGARRISVHLLDAVPDESGRTA